MDNKESFIVTETIIDSLLSTVARYQWEKEVLKGMKGYIISHSLRYSTELYKAYYDRKHDDHYLQSCEDEEIEPVRPILDQFANEKAKRIIVTQEEKEEQQDFFESPSRLDETMTLQLKRNSSYSRRPSIIRRRSSSIGSAVDGTSSTKKKIPQSEVDQFLLHNAPQTVEPWIDKTILGKTQEEIEDEERKFDQLRRRLMIEKNLREKFQKIKKESQRNKGANTRNQTEIVKLSINDGTSKVRVDRLPKLMPSLAQSYVRDDCQTKKIHSQNAQVSKIKRNNSQLKDPYMQDDAKVFQPGSKSQAKDYEDEIRNSLSSKDHMVIQDGVTFVEHERPVGKSKDQFVLKGGDYNTQYAGSKMTISQYQTMSGFHKFGSDRTQHLTQYQEKENTSMRQRTLNSRQSHSVNKTVLTTQYLQKRVQSKDKSVIIQHSEDPSIIYDNLSMSSQQYKTNHLPSGVTSSVEVFQSIQRPVTHHTNINVRKSQQLQSQQVRTRNINPLLNQSVDQDSYKGIISTKRGLGPQSFNNVSVNNSFDVRTNMTRQSKDAFDSYNHHSLLNQSVDVSYSQHSNSRQTNRLQKSLFPDKHKRTIQTSNINTRNKTNTTTIMNYN